MNSRLPVTLIGGFLGAGKTSLLHHFITEHRGGHLAVLVENPGALNLDAKALGGLCGAMRRLNDTVLAIPPLDEDAQLAWIAERLREFSLGGRHERVLIEVAGTTNPSHLARHFGLLPGQPETFAPWAELIQVVCVVDALDYFRTGQGPTSEAGFWNFQNELVAGASLVVLNKCDLLEEKDRDVSLGTLRQRHGDLRIIETAFGEVPLEILTERAPRPELESGTERDFTKIEEPAPPLASALYRVPRPFHPGRFWDWFDANHPGLLRVKGLIWLATRNLLVGGVSRTRWQNSCGAAGIWWAALPREEWPQDPAALTRMQETWQEPYGDRRQDLVLVGDPVLLSTTTRRELDACLLTDEEYARPLDEWAALTDPFPPWDLEDGTEEAE
jgi:G3E family GTPase